MDKILTHWKRFNAKNNHGFLPNPRILKRQAFGSTAFTIPFHSPSKTSSQFSYLYRLNFGPKTWNFLPR